MSEPLAVLTLLSILSLVQTEKVPQLIPSSVVKPGDNASFYCPASDKERFIYWYKQHLGRMVQTVAGGLYGKITVSEDFKDPRFSVIETIDHFVLTITKINKDDEATYFCQNGTYLGLSFVNATFLAVNDQRKTVFIKQRLEDESVQVGHSMSLQCSILSKNKDNSVQCPHDHSVHWFSAGSGEFNPGAICIHKNKSKDEDKRKCVYSLSKTTQGSCDTGTFYCAVVTCGHILFGEGTQVETKLSQTAEAPLPISSTVVKPGDSVTLHCAASDKETYFYWYKQPLGHMIQTVAEGLYSTVLVKKQFNHSRFSVTKSDTEFVFTIRKLHKEDEALYFCQSGSSFGLKFINSTFVTVSDEIKKQTPAYVEQTPASVSVLPGDSVTLQCSIHSETTDNSDQCLGEHNVHWFRSGDSHPGFIYTHKNMCGEQDKGKRVYSLSKTIQGSSDTGTYYCAVVTCGHILFGEGTQVEIEEADPRIVVLLGVLSACCALILAVLILYPREVCEDSKGISDSHRRGHEQSAVSQSNNPDGCLKNATYAALDFFTGSEIWAGKQREEACVYSVVVYHIQSPTSS